MGATQRNFIPMLMRAVVYAPNWALIPMIA
jgi:hypothetical protein